MDDGSSSGNGGDANCDDGDRSEEVVEEPEEAIATSKKWRKRVASVLLAPVGMVVCGVIKGMQLVCSGVKEASRMRLKVYRKDDGYGMEEDEAETYWMGQEEWEAEYY